MQEAETMRGHPGYTLPGSQTPSEDPMKECILLAACGANEMLPQNPDLPADVFTACLTTPIKVGPMASQLRLEVALQRGTL